MGLFAGAGVEPRSIPAVQDILGEGCGLPVTSLLDDERAVHDHLRVSGHRAEVLIGAWFRCGKCEVAGALAGGCGIPYRSGDRAAESGCSGRMEREWGFGRSDDEGVGFVAVGVDELDAHMGVAGDDNGWADQAGDANRHVGVV